jgi:hypothetical protein
MAWSSKHQNQKVYFLNVAAAVLIDDAVLATLALTTYNSDQDSVNQCMTIQNPLSFSYSFQLLNQTTAFLLFFHKR